MIFETKILELKDLDSSCSNTSNISGNSNFQVQLQITTQQL